MKPRHGLLIALLLGALFRFWQLDSFPPGLYHDEAYNGLDALMLWQGETFPQYYEGWELYRLDAHAERPPQPTRWPLFFEGNYGREPVHIYLMALSIGLLGNTVFAIRVIPALAGVLAVFTTWWAARVLFTGEENRHRREWIPVYAAFFVAILLPAVHFSRFGLRAMLFVPVETVVVACFWRGIQAREREEKGFWRQGWGWFIVAGFGLGAGIYIYAAGRLFPLLFILFIPLWLRTNWTAWRRFFLPVATMAGVSLLTAAPLLIFFYQYPYFFIFRISYVANRGRGTVEGQAWLTWLLNVGRVVRGIFWQGETHLRHNLPGRPYLDGIQAGFFVLGAGRLLGTLERRRLFLLLWLLVMLLPTIMSGDAPHFGRMTGVVPVIGIIAGLGAVWLAENIAGSAFRLAIPLLLLASTIWTGLDYFVRYAAEPQLATDFYLPEWELGQFIAAQPTETAVYLTPTQEEMVTYYYALGDPEGMASFAPGSGTPLGSAGQSPLYLLRPTEDETLARLRFFFPEGRELPEIGGVIPFVAGTLPAALPPLTLDNHIFAESIRLDGFAIVEEGDQLQVTLKWTALTEMAVDYTAFVHLVDAQGGLVAQRDRPPGGYPTSDWRSGEVVVDQYRIDINELELDSVQIRSGFYAFPSLQPLGAPADLGFWELENE